jgi:SulP family sulfate permease
MALTPRDRSRRLLDDLANEAGAPEAPAPVTPPAAAPPGLPGQIRRLAADMFAGLLVAMVTLTFSVSCAALVYAGPLAPHLPVGIATALIGASITALVVAWRSSLPLAIAGPDSHGSAVLAVTAAGIVGAVSRPEQAAPTVLAAVALGTGLTGLVLYLLGKLRVGDWVRYIPFPVVGGFLAGAGWLIVRGSFVVMADVPLGFTALRRLIEPDVLARWLPGAAFAVVLLVARRKARHFLVLPCLLLGGVLVYQLAWHLLGGFLPGESAAAWFLTPFSTSQLRETFSLRTLEQVDPVVLSRAAPDLLTLLVVVVVALLLNATGVELATQTDCDLNRELKANGLANLLTGLCGGMLGYLSLTRSLLNFKARAAGRLAGAVTGLVCGAVLLLGGSIIAVFPRPVVGGLLLSLGLDLLVEWVYGARLKLTRIDHGLVLIILAIIAFYGFLVGVGAGVVIACVVFVYSYGRQRVVRHAFTGATHRSNVDRPGPQQRFLQEQGDRVTILTLQGYIFFGTASRLLEEVRQGMEATPAGGDVRFLVLDFREVTGLDSSAVLAFVKMRQLADRAGVCRVFTGLRPELEQRLRLGGGLDGAGGPFQLFADRDRGVEWCENQLLEAGWSRRRKSVPLVLQLAELFPDPSQAAGFMTFLERLYVPGGLALYGQGEKPDAMYFIESGQVTVLLQSAGEWSLRLRTLSAGTTVGERSFFTGRPHRTSAVTERDSVLYRLSVEALGRMRAEAPQAAMVFQEFIIRLLSDHLNHAYEELGVVFGDARPA